MYDSRLTLDEAIRHISIFNPIKVTFNNLVLYNDYDSEVEIGDNVFGETAPMVCVIPDRIKNFKDIYSILTHNGASFVSRSEEEFFNIACMLLTDEVFYKKIANNCENCFKNQQGALEFVISKLKQKLN